MATHPPRPMKYRPFIAAVTAIAFAILARLATAASPGPPTSFTSRGVGGGGALFAPSFSPFSPNELYIACDMSELFHTTDLGQTWSALDFRKVQGNRGSKVQFTSDPKILYTIDYSPVGLIDMQRPSKSIDGGVTWAPTTADPTSGGAFYFFADSASTQRLIVTDYTHLYFSNDGGATWNSRYTAANSGAGLHVAGVFWDGANIYVGTNDGIVVSTNGGTSFAFSAIGGLPTGKVIAGFAGAKNGTTTRFFATVYSSADIYAGVLVESVYGINSYAGVYSVDVGQANWTKTSTNIATGHEPFFVAMLPTNIIAAYVAGRDASLAYPVVYKTTSAGASWNSVLGTVNNANIATGWQGYHGDRDWSYGEEAMGFTVAPNNVNKLAFTDFGFVHLSTDGGTSWRQIYLAPADQNAAGAATPKGKAYHSSGLENTTAWGLTWFDANNMFASFSDIRGIRSTDAGATWSFNYTGHTDNSMYRCTKAISGNTIYAATSSVHDLYQSTTLTDSRIDSGTGTIIMSNDLGATWTLMHNFSHVVAWVATDPNNANRIYASVVSSTAGGIYTTANASAGAASTWTKVANPPRTQGHPFNTIVLNDGAIVASYSARRATVNSVLQVTNSSGVFISTDGGQTWSDRSDPGMVYWTKDVVIDPHDPTQSTWFAGVFSGFGGFGNGTGGLYRTTDRGLHWTRINATDRVESCAINPNAPGELYFSSEINGLWYTPNTNAATPTFTQVDSYPFRHPERIFFNPYNANELWVTSFGNGLRVGTIPSAQPTPTPTATPTPTPTATPTPTPTPTPTVTPEPTATPTITPDPTIPPDPTPTPTATAPPTPSASPTPTPSPGRPLNISTRVSVGTADQVMIGGFIITGNDPKRVIVRALGPSFGEALNNRLADPVLELRDGNGAAVATNDDWRDSQETEIAGTGVAPQDEAESAIVRTLAPGAYTAVVSGKDASSGVALVEVYDLDQAANSQLANISTRGSVGIGDNVLVGGFIVGPDNAPGATAVVRAIGPSLEQANVSGALQNPTLELLDSNGTIVRANDDWPDGQATDLATMGLAPNDTRESALIETLAPGAYTAIVRGKGDTTGIGLVEIYNVQ